jgi:hypothetical protein
VGRSGRNHHFLAFQIGKATDARQVLVADQHLAHALVGGAESQPGGVALLAERNGGKMREVFAQRIGDFGLRQRDQFQRRIQSLGKHSRQFALKFRLWPEIGFRNDYHQLAGTPGRDLWIAAWQQQKQAGNYGFHASSRVPHSIILHQIGGCW